MAEKPDANIISETSRPMVILYGPFYGRMLILREDAAAAAEADGWGIPYADVPSTGFEAPPMADFSQGVPESYTTWTQATAGDIDAPEVPPPVVEDPDPVLTSIDPATAEVGAADFTLTATGSGFVASSVIQFDGGTMPTTFVSETSLTTLVSPAGAAVGGETVLVTVANGAKVSGSVPFSITAVPPARARRE